MLSNKIKLINVLFAFLVGLSAFFSTNLTLAQNQPTVTIHRYESPPIDAVNLYWIETNKGIILIDAGRFLSQARYALDEILAVNKPILGILITHPHTDHYGGLPVFVDAAIEDVPIYASEITYNDLKTDSQGFIKARNQLHGNDFPDKDTIPLPNHIVKTGDTIKLGGLTFEVIDLPENETITTTLYYLSQQNALFAGDFVVNQTIPFLGDGFSSNWLNQLRSQQLQYPEETIIYHGHGKPDRVERLIKAQIKYIETMRRLVAEALAGDREVTPSEQEQIVAQLEKQHSDYKTSLVLPNLRIGNIKGIAKELS
ncbi:MBL fold metallo-hydrolase [Pleurocapsa sp. FMAR1]|uniref:MBL fold metallo-hydrolase n=1 Tax=Pleurocapsa sp. FMAR1 TaxID=3040204 RepID=UPI0029C6F612|nr:MBL fold metallo-hydrolase [Pleurocapsa sp. FMAR1]